MTTPGRNDDVVSFGPDTPRRSPSRLMVVGAATGLLVMGFLAGVATNEVGAGQDRSVDGDHESAPAKLTSTEPMQKRPPRGENALRIGQTFDTGYSTITVQKFFDPFPSGKKHRPPAGTRWAGLRIQTCADADMSAMETFSAGAKEWDLVNDAGDHLMHRRTHSDTFPWLIYPPTSVSVHTGECVSGYALWALPDDFTATTAVLVPEWKASRRPSRAEWILPVHRTRPR
jgi:hypothetical protein